MKIRLPSWVTAILVTFSSAVLLTVIGLNFGTEIIRFISTSHKPQPIEKGDSAQFEAAISEMALYLGPYIEDLETFATHTQPQAASIEYNGSFSTPLSKEYMTIWKTVPNFPLLLVGTARTLATSYDPNAVTVQNTGTREITRLGFTVSGTQYNAVHTEFVQVFQNAGIFDQLAQDYIDFFNTAVQMSFVVYPEMNSLHQRAMCTFQNENNQNVCTIDLYLSYTTGYGAKWRVDFAFQNTLQKETTFNITESYSSYEYPAYDAYFSVQNAPFAPDFASDLVCAIIYKPSRSADSAPIVDCYFYRSKYIPPDGSGHYSVQATFTVTQDNTLSNRSSLADH